VQENLEALFYQNGVDMVFTGHVHAYERSYPVYNDVVRFLLRPCPSSLCCLMPFPRPAATLLLCFTCLPALSSVTRNAAVMPEHMIALGSLATAAGESNIPWLQIDKCAPVYIVIGDGGNEEVRYSEPCKTVFTTSCSASVQALLDLSAMSRGLSCFNVCCCVVLSRTI